ncbi:single-stranded DNA-binding protein [Enterobacter phage NJ2]|uniref:Single-stranded DNA-binding protein n=1 Tax=Enterobacter phage NJ2 TaxID=3108955 RepID=A0ABZ1A0S0_9CAUD|nr:single-stranded DNA-binding protein [Enterobacter phage NJ2]
MAFAKKKIFTTPLGVCEPYAYINKPDYGGVGFENPRGTFKVSLTLPNDERTQAMIDAIVKCHEEDYAQRLEAHEANPPKVQKGKKPLLPYVGDMPFFDNGDGTTTFNFKCYGSFEDRKTGETKKINLAVVDSKGKRINDVPLIAGGSEIKVKFSMVPYGWSAVAGASVKLQLEGVMLVKLASFGGGSEDDWADEVEEGGFEASNSSRQSEGTQGQDFGEEPEDEGEDESGDF